MIIFFVLLACYSSSEKVCLSDLEKEIEKVISEYPEWRWGIDALARMDEKDPYQRIYSHNLHNWFNPASNNKLITCSPFLLEYGEDWKFSTPVLKDSDGNYCIRAQGDPSMDYDRLKEIVQNITNAGAKNLFVDVDSYFGELNPPFPPTWNYDDVPEEYGAQPTSTVLKINKDVLIIKPGLNVGDPARCSTTYSPIEIPVDCSLLITGETGSTTTYEWVMKIGDPVFYVAGSIPINHATITDEFSLLTPKAHFVNVLTNYFGRDVPTVAECKGDVAMEFLSDELVNLMNYTLLVSDNTFTELYMRQIGAKYRLRDDGLISQTAFYVGKQKIREILLNEFKMSETDFSQSDASGVSRRTFVSPFGITKILEKMESEKSLLKYMLPRAGISGTLEQRFLDHKGILYAKTGTLTGVGALGGYIVKPSVFQEMIFSIIVNDSHLSSTGVREHIDKVALYLAFADPSC